MCLETHQNVYRDPVWREPVLLFKVSPFKEILLSSFYLLFSAFPFICGAGIQCVFKSLGLQPDFWELQNPSAHLLNTKSFLCDSNTQIMGVTQIFLI